MTAKVLPLRPRRPLAKAKPAYPDVPPGVHITVDPEGCWLTVNRNGRSTSERLTPEEARTLRDQITLAEEIW